MLMGAILLIASPANPEYGVIPESTIDPAVMRIEEEKYLGTPVNGDYTFLDEKGKEFMLKDIMGRSIILVLSYFSCDGACPTTNAKLRDTLTGMNRFRIGKDYSILTLSFDRNDDIHSLKMFTDMTGLQNLSGDGWKIAVMKNKEEIERFTGSVGFKFFWSPRDKMFLHPNVFIFLSPTGRIVRYLYGTPLEIRDVELALTEANFEKAAKSKIIDLISMACYSYNFKEGRYILNSPLFIGFGSLLLGISFVVGPIILFRKRRGARV